MSIQPIEDSKRTITAMVQERVRDAILEGLLPAGSRIDQNQLAADLNVSLVPVREALHKLQGEGFVQIIPRRGAFVAESSLEDMADIYFTRQITEGQAAYHAAPRLSDEELAQLDKLCAAMEQAIKAQHYPDFMRQNHDFHFIIYQAAGSRYLLNMITSLWDLSERYRYRYMYLKDQGEAVQAEHREILAACHARDSKRLRDAIIMHMQHTEKAIRSYYVAHPNGGDTD